MKFNEGDTAYLIESGRIIREGQIVRRSGDLYLFRFVEGGGLKVKEHRLYATYEEAESVVKTGSTQDRKRNSNYRYEGNLYGPIGKK